MSTLQIELPPKLIPVFAKPNTFIRGAYGGRGSAKTRTFAKMACVRVAMWDAEGREGIVLCVREFMNSLDDSSFAEIKAAITSDPWLSSIFDVGATYIRTKSGRIEFKFVGLSKNLDSIKSKSRILLCWADEAEPIIEVAWIKLIATIREEGSELWVTWNPELEDSATDKRFRKTTAPDMIVVEINWRDNPWFPSVLEAERKHAKETLKPDLYAHIWEGRCMPAVEGAIYFDQVAQADKRIKEVPHDGLLKTHAVFDLGFNDAMSIILVQKASSELRIVNYVEGTQRTLPDYSADLKALRLDGQPINWGEVYLPHDGFAKRHQTGKADADVMRELGWSVQKVPEIGVEMGINRAREIFPRVYFNEERTKRLIECLKRYRRQINQTTGEPGQPLHDEFSHAADAFRYMAVVSDSLGNDSWGGSLSYPRLNVA